MGIFNLKKVISRKPWILNLLKSRSGWSPFPLFYIVHLTLSCNAHCYFCYQKASGFKAKDKEYGKIMSVEDFEEIMKQAKQFLHPKPLIHLFGGEPLIHPQFEEILKLTKKYGYPYSLTTNGILLGKHMESIGHSNNLKQINISIYGKGDIHNNIVGHPGIFDDIINNIEKLGHILRKNGRKKMINLNMVLTKENMHQCLELASFLNKRFSKEELGAVVIQFPADKNFNQSISADYLQSLGKIKENKLDFDILFTAKDWINWEDQSGNKQPTGSCNLPWLGIGILPNLDVMPAGSISTCSRIIGNLKKTSIKSLWNGKELKKFRRSVFKGIPESCYGCCHAQLPKNKN